MAGAKIALGSTAGELKQDVDGNAKINLPIVEDNAGFAAMLSEIDAGDVLTTRRTKALEVTSDFRARIAIDTPIFMQSFEGTIIPQANIQLNLSTMTAPMSGGWLQLNAGNATASGNAANFRTYRTFKLDAAAGLHAEFWIREANDTATGAISEWGLGYAAGVATPTDGVFFRRLSGGQLIAVVNFAGAETTLNITTTDVPNRDTTGAFAPTEAQHYLIYEHNDECLFWINNVLVAAIPTPSSQGGPTQTCALPAFGRVYNTAIASAGRRLEVGFLGVTSADVNTFKPWGHILGGMGCGGYQTQSGATSGQTAQYSTTAIAAPTWTTNTAPATNSFGGEFITPAPMPAGTSGLATVAPVHYPVFAFLNPAGTNALPGKTLYITSIRVGETFVTSTLGASATVLQLGAAVGSTAPSLATADGAATLGPRRVVLGCQTFIAAAAVGVMAAGYEVSFGESPLVVPPGCYFHIIAALFINAATGSLHGSVTPVGYYE